MRLRIISPDGTTSELMVASPEARLGRDPGCKVAFDPAAYPKVSGEHARIERTATGLVLTHLSRSNKTLLNGTPIEGATALKVGDKIRLGYSGPTVEVLDVEAPRGKSAPPGQPAAPSEPADPVEGYGTTVQADSEHHVLLRGSFAAQRFEIGSRRH